MSIEINFILCVFLACDDGWNMHFALCLPVSKINGPEQQANNYLHGHSVAENESENELCWK